MTGALVALNVAVFALWHTVGRSPAGRAWLVANFLVSVGSIHRPWTLLLAEFSHVDPVHLLFNMVALWSFGRTLESVLGARRLLTLYVMGGVLASLGYVVYGLAVHSAAPALRDTGVLVVLAGTIEAADAVTKTHSSALDTFKSLDTGPLGSVGEGGVSLARRRGGRRRRSSRKIPPPG